MGKTEVIVGLFSAFLILHHVELSSTLAMKEDLASMSESNQGAATAVEDKLGKTVKVESVEEGRTFVSREDLSDTLEKIKCVFVDCPITSNQTTTTTPAPTTTTTTAAVTTVHSLTNTSETTTSTTTPKSTL